MEKSQVLIPEEAYAYQFGNTLTIVASGREDGYTNIRIAQSPAQIFPPIFHVVGDSSPAIGNFPYRVHGSFKAAAGLKTIFMTTADGKNEIPVKQFTEADLAAKAPKTSVLSANPADNEVVGISPNSYDVNRAVSDAVNKLQKKYPANVNATVVETGVVAVGTPVGITYLYVKMQQNG